MPNPAPIPTQLNIAPRGKTWKNWQLVDGTEGFPTHEAMEQFHCNPERVRELEQCRELNLETIERQAALIQLYESQLETIGAGGVEPLRKAAALQAEAIAEIVSASHEAAEFGERSIRFLRDIQHLEYGTKLYPGPGAPSAPQAVHAATESVLIDGVAYEVHAEVAAELLRLHARVQKLADERYAIIAEKNEYEVAFRAVRLELEAAKAQRTPLTPSQYEEILRGLGVRMGRKPLADDISLLRAIERAHGIQEQST